MGREIRDHRFADQDSEIQIIMRFKRNGKTYEMEMDASEARLETVTYYPEFRDIDICMTGASRTESVVLTANIKPRHGDKYGRTKRID